MTMAPPSLGIDNSFFPNYAKATKKPRVHTVDRNSKRIHLIEAEQKVYSLKFVSNKEFPSRKKKISWPLGSV